MRKLSIAGGEKNKYQPECRSFHMYFGEGFILYQYLQRFSIACRNDKTKPVTYLDCSANLKP